MDFVWANIKNKTARIRAKFWMIIRGPLCGSEDVFDMTFPKNDIKILSFFFFEKTFTHRQCQVQNQKFCGYYISNQQDCSYQSKASKNPRSFFKIIILISSSINLVQCIRYNFVSFNARLGYKFQPQFNSNRFPTPIGKNWWHFMIILQIVKTDNSLNPYFYAKVLKKLLKQICSQLLAFWFFSFRKFFCVPSCLKFCNYPNKLLKPYQIALSRNFGFKLWKICFFSDTFFGTLFYWNDFCCFENPIDLLKQIKGYHTKLSLIKRQKNSKIRIFNVFFLEVEDFKYRF